MKGSSPAVVIGVGRHRGGGDNNPCWRLPPRIAESTTSGWSYGCGVDEPSEIRLRYP